MFTISDADVENISKIKFSVKDELGLRRRARIEAGLKAKEKADDIANSLGVSVREVLVIEEIQATQTSRDDGQYSLTFGGGSYLNPFNPPSTNFYLQQNSLIDETKGTGFFAQTVTATSQVRVTFEINKN